VKRVYRTRLEESRRKVRVKVHHAVQDFAVGLAEAGRCRASIEQAEDPDESRILGFSPACCLTPEKFHPP